MLLRKQALTQEARRAFNLTRDAFTDDVQDAADAITVSTGPLKFVVKKKGFNVIDSALFDGQPIIASHNRGAIVVVDGAAGEDVGTAHEVAVEVAPQHEDLEALVAVAHEHDGGGVA